ncbi:MAG: flavoprotein [Bacteroidia bacterium]|nr:flavoprotein [Bacteroidia bacterium]
MRPNITIGVTGSSSIYKTCHLIRILIKKFNIKVIMTRNATEFITPFYFEVLTGNPVLTDLYHKQDKSYHPHIAFTNEIQLFCIAPASSNFLGKLVNGIADDALTTSAVAVLPSEIPCLIAPAMNSKMYGHPSTQNNLNILRKWGYKIIEPTLGNQTCGYYGIGRLSEPEDIATQIFDLLI